MPNRRRRATATRTLGRQRATYLAARLGRALKDSRLARRFTQAQVAERAGVSQAFWSRLERGLVTTASLETLAASAAAVDVQLAAFIEARPGADLPRDIEHVRRQEVVVTIAAGGGWHARPERPIDPTAARSRSIDVLLERVPAKGGREIAVVEIEDLLADVGEVFRGLADKVAAIEREQGPGSVRDDMSRVAGLLILRATRRNRETVHRLGAVFKTRFPASSAAWLRALSSAAGPMPDRDGFAWSSVRGHRLFATRPAGDGRERG